MAEVFQKPKAAGGAHAGVFFVENNFFRFVDAAQFQNMMDHVHEGLERRFTGIDETKPKQIEMNGAWDMLLSKLFGRTYIDDA